MVEKLTLFELRMDSPRFGTNEGSEDAGPDIEEAIEMAPEGRGPNFGRLVLASILFSVAATVVARRFAGGDDEQEIEIDEMDEETPIEVEH